MAAGLMTFWYTSSTCEPDKGTTARFSHRPGKNRKTVERVLVFAMGKLGMVCRGTTLMSWRCEVTVVTCWPKPLILETHPGISIGDFSVDKHV
jgi:hypothetical protein